MCLLIECYTISTQGYWDGYINVSVPSNSSNCNGCTDWLTDVYSDSQSDFCLEEPISSCADGEQEVWTYGYNVGSYTLEYTDGTIIEMSYTDEFSDVYECIPEGDYTVCVDFGGSDNGYFYFGDYYWDACNMNGTCNGSNGSEMCQGLGSCDNGFNYYIYTYTNDNNCSVDRTFSIVDVLTGDTVWSNDVNACNSESTTACLPYGEYEGCVNPPFNGNGGSFEVAYINALGGYNYIVQMSGWNNNVPACEDLSVPNPTITAGCTDPLACNYDSEADVDNGSCSYPPITSDCDGNCNEGYEADCNGVCGGSSFINDCGWCEDPDQDYAISGFTGNFAPEFWTEYYGSGNGIITWNEDGTLYIEGSDGQGGSWETSGDWNIDFEGTNDMDSPTEVTMVLSQDAEISFDWDYNTNDGPYYDVAYFINGDAFMLSNPNISGSQSGTTTFNATAGDVIGFAMDAGDNCCGSGWVTISNFMSIGQDPCVLGCTDLLACNYMPEATDDDGSCIMPPEGYCDCDGNVFDECGDCNGDGPTPGYDCDDNCISQEILFQVDMWGGNATEWSVYDSNGNVVLSGNNPYNYNCDGMYCGDLVCGFNFGECYTFEANGSFDGNVWIYLPTPDQCNGCTQQIAYLDGWSGQTSVNFCVPEECSDDEVLDNTYAYGWSGYDEVSWTITNVLTGEEVMSGDVQMNQTSEFACFEDGIYALTVCDTESGPNNYDDDWYVDICVETGTYNPDQCAYINGYDFNYGPSGEACETEYFAVNMFMGCMDPLADNYNPYAAYQPDADACIYPCPEESFIIVNANPWGGVDGDETWVITDDATGEVVLSGNIPFTYSDCDVYCGDIECLLPGCYTITTTGDFDGYINISEPSPQCNGCTNYLGEVYSNSSMSFCIGGTDCGDGYEEVYTYGYNVGSYTIEYTDGTVLEMSYTNDWNEVYECIPEGDYTICIDFGGSDNGYFYFGDMYWDAWSIYNGYSNGGDVCVNSTDGECSDDSYQYYVYAYNDCNVDERTYELTHVETGDVVWSTTMFGCNSSFNEEICLPYGTYEACITPPFSQDQGGSFELAYVPEMGNNIYLIQMNGWNNDTAACSDLSVPEPMVPGCMDPAACNYNPEAELDNFTCFYATETTDCDGNCNEGYVADCNGDCGGTAVEDECGDCGGNGPTPGYDCDDNCISQEILFQVDMWGGNATEWSVYDSNGNVVLSGNNPYNYNCDGMYCGDLVCGFNFGECYTFEANGSFDGNVWIYLPTPDQCNGCTQQIAYLDGWSGQTSVNFCVPEECSDDEVLDNTYAYGWSGYDEVSWTITNVLTGEEVMSGDVQMNQTSEFACFEDGIYALTVCDTESGPNNYDDDWYVDICVETGTYNPDQCAYINGYDFNYGPSGEACETEYFAVNMFMGCMDPLADNYNPYAAYQPDADACIYPCPEESFIIVNANPWGGVDGDETWVITDDATGEVVLSGNIPFTYSDCDVYCGDIECLLPGCYTITTTGDFDGYINISEPSPQCNGCTNYLGEVYSNSSMSFCIGGTDCGDGYEEVYTYGYNVGSYTIEYTDGTVLEMSYTDDWNEVYECIQRVITRFVLTLVVVTMDTSTLATCTGMLGAYTTATAMVAMCVLTARMVNVLMTATNIMYTHTTTVMWMSVLMS